MTPDAERLYLVFDQGGHASRAFVFDERGEVVASGMREIAPRRPRPGFVEYDPDEMLQSLQEALQEALRRLGDGRKRLVAAAMATQRSNVACWNADGAPLGPLISWQDRRAAERVDELARKSRFIHERSGLFLTAHYGASKLRWCLDNVAAVAQAYERGRLGFGPMAAWLAARLTNGAAAADVVNASRTQLMNLDTLDWDDDLLAIFNVPRKPLPPCVPNIWRYGGLLQAQGLELKLVSGDQSVALFAHGELDEQTAYINTGTGAFVSRPSGRRRIYAERLLTSVVHSDGRHSEYVLEGTVNGAGAALEWFRREYGVADLYQRLDGWLQDAASPAPLFLNGVSGLGAPFWVPNFKSRFVGEGDTGQLAAALVESIVFLLYVNLLEMAKYLKQPRRLRVSGGLARLDGFCQRLADLSGLPVYRPRELEATARGAAFLLAGRPRDWPELAAPEVFAAKDNAALRDRFDRWRREMRRSAGY